MVDLGRLARNSVGSGLKSSLQGIVVGLAFAAGSVVLLFWNEGRAVQRAKTLEEGAGAVVSVPSSAVDPTHEGHLVHLSGRAETERTLADPKFGLRVEALRLFREVEMLQWKERVESRRKKKNKSGGGSTPEKTYHYDTTWSSSAISSDSFKVSEGHRNPPFPFRGESWTASDIHIGAFFLTDELTSRLTDRIVLALADEHLAAVPEPLRSRLSLNGGTFYQGANPSSPAVGDVRVRFQIVRPGDTSVVGRQQGDRVVAYTTKAGGDIALLDSGIRTAEQMFQRARTENTVLTWGLRVVGFVVMFIAFSLVLRPLSVVADALPFVGKLVGAGVAIVAFLIAALLTLGTVAVGWIVYRPWLGITLLVVCVGLVVVMTRLARQPSHPTAPLAVPPPPPFVPPPPPPPPPPAT